MKRDEMPKTAISALAAKQNLAVQILLEKLYFLNFLLNKRPEKIKKTLKTIVCPKSIWAFKLSKRKLLYRKTETI
jgi:hypothetical protein